MSNKTNTYSRRQFLQTAAVAAGTPLMVSRVGLGAHAFAGPSALPFGTALEAAAAIRSTEISSVELTTAMFDRIAKYNETINAIVTLTRDAALKRAAEADAAQSKGESWGPLHGVPITIKDTFELEGVRTTAGASFLSNYVGKRDAVGVTRLKKAGAVILGKTNVPFMAGDVQTYNTIFGTTNNPWNLERTPGGSTGGGAASLAAGLTFLSFGSDIAGSIRTPANFCGVFGHKPSSRLVPTAGHIPPPPGIVIPRTSGANLGAAGPLARSAEDLVAAMKILGGPTEEDAGANRWELSPSRHESLKDFKVGFMLDDPFCPVTPETKAILASALKAAEMEGATLVEGWPKGVIPDREFENYFYLLSRVIDRAAPRKLHERNKELAQRGDKFAKIRTRAKEDSASAGEEVLAAQKENRERWGAYFEKVDVFLSPVTFTPAIPHDQSEQATRILDTTLGDRSYGDLFCWIAPANYSGCPATSMPAGLTPDGLPVGLQIMGPFLEDGTPIRFAQELSKHVGGYKAPAGFGSIG